MTVEISWLPDFINENKTEGNTSSYKQLTSNQ
jgi:hypothetical protein